MNHSSAKHEVAPDLEAALAQIDQPKDDCVSVPDEMKVEILRLTSDDLDAVDDLMKRNSRTLGFLPTEALTDYLHKGCVLGAKVGRDSLIGYLLYASSQSRFRVVQLCVSQEFRGRSVANRLLEELKQVATTQSAITLSCRRDFPAHYMWPKLGFVAIGEKPGRSEARHLLTLWHLTLNPANQMDLGLFKARTSDETVDVIIDAQVFFDLSNPDSDGSERSTALLSDFLVASLNLWTTDELFNEINRSDDSEQRRIGRESLRQFPQVVYSSRLVDDFDSSLRGILPHRTPSQISDIRHLAKAASSDVNVFVTRDRSLLARARDIADLTNLRVLSPTELIIELHELLDGQSYGPDRVSGLRLGWHRFTVHDLASLPVASFLNEGEGQRQLEMVLDSYLVRPNAYQCELLKAGDLDVAIRVIPTTPEGAVTVPLARVARSPDRSLFGRFLIADTIAKAVDKNQDMVEFGLLGLTPALIPDLMEMGFTRCRDNLVKFCFSGYLDREAVLKKIAALSPESEPAFADLSDLELERYCAPVSLNAHQSYFLVPIRPGYAMSLIDRQLSSTDMFGGDPSVLLRWENVYYRKATTSQRILKAPGRILWYVSRSQKQIVAVSHLDEVVVDTAKELLKRFKRFGVLGWEELYRMCDGDTSMELMALQFSHTFVFRRRIPLNDVRTVYEEDASGLTVQLPTSMPASRFQKLLKLGFSDWS